MAKSAEDTVEGDPIASVEFHPLVLDDPRFDLTKPPELPDICGADDWGTAETRESVPS